ncbi:hypothetical protein QL093DRAFT_2122897 [Fusarium oxysporum]|nr:hypothetical protein QL093DRAFT_2122897 [Fusarium oxysporum]
MWISWYGFGPWYDGRGKGHQCGANGDKQLNANHYAVLAFLGKNGVSQPSQSQIMGIQDAIAYLRRAGAGNEIKGHRDGYSTECPGEPLYKLVKDGTLDPGKLWDGGTHEVEPNETLGDISLKYNIPQRYIIDVNKLKAPYDLKVGEKLEIPARGTPLGEKAPGNGGGGDDGSDDDPGDGGDKLTPFPGADWFKSEPYSSVITAMGKRLVAAGCNKYSKEEKLGYTGADADGWPGESSWSKLEVPWTKDGDVGNQTLAPFPGAEWFKSKPNSPTVTAIGKRLVAVGCNKYSEGPGPQWTVSDQNSYKCWQEKLGFTGSDANGWPGKTSWDKLRVPKTMLSQLKLFIDVHARVLICSHDTCRVALSPSPAQVSEHLRKKHNIAAAERRLVTDLLKTRISPLQSHLKPLYGRMARRTPELTPRPRVYVQVLYRTYRQLPTHVSSHNFGAQKAKTPARGSKEGDVRTCIPASVD